MARKKKKHSSFHAALNIQRRLAVQQGFYDGRFRVKREKDKKKESSKRLARRRVDPDEMD